MNPSMKFWSVSGIDWHVLNAVIAAKFANSKTCSISEGYNSSSEGNIYALVTSNDSNCNPTYRDYTYCEKLITDLKTGQVEFPILLASRDSVMEVEQESYEKNTTELKSLVELLRVSAILSIFGWCCRTSESADSQIFCEICDRVIPFNNIFAPVNSNTASDKLGSKFCPINDHRYFCPWISEFQFLGTSKATTAPGWQLCNSAVTGDGNLLNSHYASVRSTDNDRREKLSVAPSVGIIDADLPLKDVFQRINAVVNMMSDLPS